MIKIKTKEQLECMRESGRLTKEVLELLGREIKVGMSTKQLDKIAYDYITSCGAYPSFLGYSSLTIQTGSMSGTMEIGDLITGNQYDLIYVRLERGLSPDISGLLTETGLIGRTGYSQNYKEQIEEITMATTWDEMCELLNTGIPIASRVCLII